MGESLLRSPHWVAKAARTKGTLEDSVSLYVIDRRNTLETHFTLTFRAFDLAGADLQRFILTSTP